MRSRSRESTPWKRNGHMDQKELHRLSLKESESDELELLRAEEEVCKKLNDINKSWSDELITVLKEKVSRLEAQPDKTSSVHIEQDRSTMQENPIIPIGEPGNIPDGGLWPLRQPTLPKCSG